MAVLGVARCDFPVMFDIRKVRVYTVLRDDSLIEWIRSCEQELAERIVAGNPPEPDWEHPGATVALQTLHGLHDHAVDLSEEHEGYVWQSKELAEEIKSLTAQRAGLNNRLLAAMHGAARAVLPNGQHLSRSAVADSYVTEDDVLALADRVGEVKRKGHERLNLPRKRKT
jgi:predicted phage-related endonuclease